MEEENKPILLPMGWHEPIRCEQTTQAFFEGDLRRPAEDLCHMRTVTDPIKMEEFSDLPAGEKRSISKEPRKSFIAFP
jgi:hypothetical protein